MNEDAAKALRAEFEPGQIGKLPRVTCRDCSDKKATCQKHQKSKCSVCGAYISTAHIHLDYVGHAGITDRLLQVDPEWSWEPVSFDEAGAPLVQYGSREARMWIQLTVAETTRYGVGIAPGDSFELEKVLIGDALRNAAMRFGVALDLWSKEDLHVNTVDPDTGEIADRAGDRTSPPPTDGGQSSTPQNSGPRPAKLASEPQMKLLALLAGKQHIPEGCPWPIVDGSRNLLIDCLPLAQVRPWIDELKAAEADEANEPKPVRVNTKAEHAAAVDKMREELAAGVVQDEFIG